MELLRTESIASPVPSTLFNRVICGVDRSAAGLLAAAVAARLSPPEGSLTLVHVAPQSIESPWAAYAATRDVADGAERTLERAGSAAEPFHSASVELLYGRAGPRLLEELRDADASLVVVGARTASRMLGVLLGSVATRMVHSAPCSVLVVRHVMDPTRFPGTVTVGDDGSPEAARAAEEADAIASRFGAAMRVVAASGAGPIDVARCRGAGEFLWDQRSAVDALVDASRTSELVVLGSRGLHGAAAIGSVSERVAHRAKCSVLVVRANPDDTPSVTRHDNQ
jgi:nucleotide-binding universal stress UspA family protein